MDTGLYNLLLAFFVALVMYLFDGYRRGELRRPEQELERTFKGLAVAFATMFSAEVLFLKGVPQSRSGTSLWYVFGFILVLTGRFSVRALYARLRRAGYGLRKSIIIGSPSGLEGFEQHLAIQRYRGHEVRAVIPAFLSSNDDSVAGLNSPDHRETENWRETVQRVGADVVVVNLADGAGSNPFVLDIIRRCIDLGVEVDVCSPLFHTNSLDFEIDSCLGCLRLRPSPKWLVRTQHASKTVLDLFIGSIGSLVTLLILPAIWVLIKLEDGGPVFYHSEYLGCDGQIHYYLKFRTMIQNADAVLQNDPELKKRFAEKQKLRDDPRALKSGRILRKFSIDEFPQFFSVLTGQLSFVGPRTIRSSEGERYGGSLAKLLSVKPGLSGYWQVMGRQTTTYDERILMDMFYIDHWSIWLDIVIIAKTGGMFFSQKGAY